MQLDDIKTHIIKKPEDLEVKDNFAYFIGSNGIFLKRKGFLFDSVVKVNGIPNLEPIQPTIKLNINKIGKIPIGLIHTSLEFFRKVYDEYKSEAVLLFTLDDGKWGLYCPKQEVSAGSLDYEVEDTTNTVVGSIHSHADFSAFHSGIDTEDEMAFDGVHMTLGFVNSKPEIVLSLMSGGTRQTLKIEDIIDRTKTKIPIMDPDWMKQVTHKTYTYGRWNPKSGKYEYPNYRITKRERKRLKRLNMTKAELDEKIAELEKEWNAQYE